MSKKATPEHDEGTLTNLVRRRYAPPTWACLSQVRNATGFSSGRTRTADAIAVGCWPSRGEEIHGVEIKVSRGDWLRELKDPEKAELSWIRWCHRWWIAAPEGIVLDGELPPAWGLLEPDGAKGRLVARIEAPALSPMPLPIATLAALLRRAQEDSPSERALKDAVAKAEAKAHQDSDELWKGQIERLKKDLLEKRQRIMRFEQETGLALEGREFARYRSLKNQVPLGRIGDIVRAVAHADAEVLRHAENLRRFAGSLDEAAAAARAQADAIAAHAGKDGPANG